MEYSSLIQWLIAGAQVLMCIHNSTLSGRNSLHSLLCLHGCLLCEMCSFAVNLYMGAHTELWTGKGGLDHQRLELNGTFNICDIKIVLLQSMLGKMVGET